MARSKAWRIKVTIRWLRAAWRHREWPWRVPWGVGMIVKPSDAQVERARQIARERGWLVDEVWVWDRD